MILADEEIILERNGKRNMAENPFAWSDRRERKSDYRRTRNRLPLGLYINNANIINMIKTIY
ncbi:MAG: hypothetical protein J6Y30_04770 [Treponema sp.]|nr:hypothetical protein [Treponema sp.]